MRWLALLLAGLLGIVQWSLWFGHGGRLRVHDLERQLATQRQANEQQRVANEGLAAEVQSLRDGREAVEERARFDLHMMRGDETFFQLLPAAAQAAGPAAGPPAAAASASPR